MTHEDEHANVFTLKEAAQYLRVSVAHLSNVINGKVQNVPFLCHARGGRRVLIKREWADDWLDRCKVSRDSNLRIISGTRS